MYVCVGGGGVMWISRVCAARVGHFLLFELKFRSQGSIWGQIPATEGLILAEALQPSVYFQQGLVILTKLDHFFKPICKILAKFGQRCYFTDISYCQGYDFDQLFAGNGNPGRTRLYWSFFSKYYFQNVILNWLHR